MPISKEHLALSNKYKKVVERCAELLDERESLFKRIDELNKKIEVLQRNNEVLKKKLEEDGLPKDVNEVDENEVLFVEPERKKKRTKKTKEENKSEE
ncbi:MAG: hypothetical protein NC548_42560 [Lachnospiraceae bacterium]|nr:hypothetical protein [Lachnospiraceae bacterium]